MPTYVRNSPLTRNCAAGLLLGHAAPALAMPEQPPEPFDEIERFIAGGALGILVLTPDAPDRQTPLVLALNDALGRDGRAGLCGAGTAVLEIEALEGDPLDAVRDAPARHPRVAGQPIRLLSVGASARLAAEWPGPVAARALPYPGCGEPIRAAMWSGPLIHGGGDPAHEPAACAGLGVPPPLAPDGAARRGLAKPHQDRHVAS